MNVCVVIFCFSDLLFFAFFMYFRYIKVGAAKAPPAPPSARSLHTTVILQFANQGNIQSWTYTAFLCEDRSLPRLHLITYAFSLGYWLDNEEHNRRLQDRITMDPPLQTPRSSFCRWHRSIFPQPQACAGQSPLIGLNRRNGRYQHKKARLRQCV